MFRCCRWCSFVCWLTFVVALCTMNLMDLFCCFDGNNNNNHWLCAIVCAAVMLTTIIKFVNLGKPAPKMYNSYSSLGITVTACVAPFNPSHHFPPLTTIHSIARFYVQIRSYPCPRLFPCFPGPTSLSGSRKKWHISSSSKHHPFMKHVHTVAICFSLDHFYYVF